MVINQEGTTFQIVLYEGNGTEPIPAEEQFGIASSLLDRGYALSFARPESSASPGALPLRESLLLVLGNFGGRPPVLEDADNRVEIAVRDIAGRSPDGVVELVDEFRDGKPMNQPGRWKPWFPVIDYDRCTNCLQCLSFCLFDVYGLDADKRIQVQNNDNCKTNCPACSRVCPEVAIMFPKYASGPINGEPVSAEDVEREKMKVDISSLLGGDIYSRLRQRSEQAKSRFSKERSADKALAERKKCLTKLQGDGLIPPEVLENLPSPEEIERRAAAAAAKVQEALASRAASEGQN